MRRVAYALACAGILAGCAQPAPEVNREWTAAPVASASVGSGFVARFAALQGLEDVSRVSLRCVGVLSRAAESGPLTAETTRLVSSSLTLLRHTGQGVGRRAGLNQRQMDAEVAAGRQHIGAQQSRAGIEQVIGTCLYLAQDLAEIARDA